MNGCSGTALSGGPMGAAAAARRRPPVTLPAACRTDDPRDGAFAEALCQTADHCGDEVQQQVLSRVAKWTCGDVERLAKLGKDAMQDTVQAVLEPGKRLSMSDKTIHGCQPGSRTPRASK